MTRTKPAILTPTFALLLVGHFMQALGYASMLLLPLYLNHLGANRTQIGAVMATSAIGGLLFRPAVGWALDTVGRRPTLVVGTLVLSLGMGLVWFATEMGPLIYLSKFLVGVGVGTLFTAYFAFAADLIPAARRTEGLALFGVSGLVPLAVAPMAQRFGVLAPDLRWFFPVIGVVVALSLLPVLALKEPPRPAPPVGGRPSAWAALSLPPLLPVWFATIVFAGLVAIFMAFATVTAQARGQADPAAIWLAYAVAAVGVRLLGPRLPDRVGPANLVAPALACYGVAFLLLAEADTRWVFLMSGLLAGVAHGYCFPVLTAQVINRVPFARRGSAMALFTAIWDGAALVLAPAFGVIADATDDATMYAFATLLATIGLGFWALLEHRLGRSVQDTARDS